MTLNLSPSLKLAQLKALAIACGLASSGTKDGLLRRLESSTRLHRDSSSLSSLNSTPRILSIDMGIRNLAFAQITPAPLMQSKKSGTRLPPPVVIDIWQRVDLLETLRSRVENSIDPDQWSPAAMADLTVEVVQQKLLKSMPTHILIERQRFRSGGGAAVQEWTLRVNMIEAMLHATLRTLQSLGYWDGTVYSIAPSRVGPFFLECFDSAEPRKGSEAEKAIRTKLKTAKMQNKKAKIDLVGRLLETTSIVISGEAKLHAEMYLNRWKGIRRSKGADDQLAGESFHKLDDMADCLLQGLAWMKWEENKRLLAIQGPSALLPN
ncbi:mitochondrial resolvase Ydc2 [Xylariales sp. PMI_506]|nr:mitochondrial resolvase Ydc2 [Xylariales sp. PMI_506]